MQQWRKDMNAALGVARAQAEAGNAQEAIDAANRAMSMAKNVAAVTAVHGIRQQIYEQVYTSPPTTTPSGGGGGGGGAVPSGSGGGGGGSITSYAAPAPPPAPVLPNFKPMGVTNKNFKVAPSDIIQFDDESIEIALITDLLFEDIGATELSNISRYDLIDGQNVIYEPIKNLSTVRREFNPNNIVSTSLAMDYFSRFAIDLSLRGISNPYFDENGNLVIEIESVQDSEEIQVQILTNGTIDLVEDV